MTADQVRALLARKCREAGSQRAWAKAIGVTPPYVHDVLLGRREPGPAILRALGLERVVTVTYRRAAGRAGEESR